MVQNRYDNVCTGTSNFPIRLGRRTESVLGEISVESIEDHNST